MKMIIMMMMMMGILISITKIPGGCSANNPKGIGYRTVVLPNPSNHLQSSLGILFEA